MCTICQGQCSRFGGTKESEISALVDSRNRILTINKITKKIYCDRQNIVPHAFCRHYYIPVNILHYIAKGALQLELSLLNRQL